MTPREARAVADAIDLLTRGHVDTAIDVLRRIQNEQMNRMMGQPNPGPEAR